ncbi:MAG TPA: hemerythrin domain-containing protein [Thermodesulfobacteriota bacterium]|nr:hemerythrin domain-containing protein [Thermodesulfobacteriota bacterium]
MKETFLLSRRIFLRRAGGFTGGLIASAGLLAEAGISPAASGKKKEEAEVSPPEDLMREHGILSRILLVYGEILKRFIDDQAVPPDVLGSSAGLIRRFIEDYHEKLEEEYLFPRFEKAGKLVDLVKALREQHAVGRRLTDWIQEGAGSASLKNRSKGGGLGRNIFLFIAMYRPHKAREDTVLFPAIHSLFSPDEFDKLGDQFEEREQALLGENGFARIVSEVAELEKKLDIYELSRFTPKL